jgi:hypothetical protein
MKTLCSIAVVGLVVLLMAVPCAEEAGDGNTLLEYCRDAIQDYDAGGGGGVLVSYHGGYCTGFVAGALEMHRAYYVSQSGSTLRPLFCVPAQGIRVIQGMRILVHYLETHPERLHLQELVLVIEAFRDAFPCTPAASRPQR